MGETMALGGVHPDQANVSYDVCQYGKLRRSVMREDKWWRMK